MDDMNGKPPVVKMRRERNQPISPLATNNSNNNEMYDSIPDGGTRSLLSRTMDVLHETDPIVDEGNEEIKRLDSQLDHLNEYMDKVEKRLREHSDKLLATLKEQKEEREKRRRSFHERLQSNQQEDNDFQERLNSLLTRVDISKNRSSVYDIISNMEIPKVEDEKK
uniref:BBP1_C domain-containing protein n=1 Tax=Strongyloides venezuelensis TaxID=75913 RepID=A0A0K0F4G5_STRVS